MLLKRDLLSSRGGTFDVHSTPMPACSKLCCQTVSNNLSSPSLVLFFLHVSLSLSFAR